MGAVAVVAAAADADRPHAAILGKTRNNHGLINKYRQTGPNHHPWEDAFTERPHSGVSHCGESSQLEHTTGQAELDMSSAHRAYTALSS